jgi:hypothetical protein
MLFLRVWDCVVALVDPQRVVARVKQCTREVRFWRLMT